MGNIKKIIDKMNRQPNNISFEEAIRVRENYGFKVSGIKGSHH